MVLSAFSELPSKLSSSSTSSSIGEIKAGPSRSSPEEKEVT